MGNVAPAEETRPYKSHKKSEDLRTSNMRDISFNLKYPKDQALLLGREKLQKNNLLFST